MKEATIKYIHFLIAAIFLTGSIANAENAKFDVDAVTASSVPAGLDLCADYGSRIACTGRDYAHWGAGRRFVSRHEGMDFAAKPGTKVIAASDAWVVWEGINKCGGGFVFFDTGAKVKDPRTGKDAQLYLGYFHIVSNVSRNQFVKAGTVIGEVAEQGPNAGSCWGLPHVHFATRVSDFKLRFHVSPNNYWVDGVGKVTCWRDGMTVEKGKIVAPLLC